MGIRNDLLQQILDTLIAQGGGIPSSYAIERITAVPYTNNTPSDAVEYDTGYDPATSLQSTTEVTVLAKFTSGGNEYAIFKRISATAFAVNPDVRVGETASFSGVTGSTDLILRYDTATSSIHVEINFDGGGKTLDSIQVITAYDEVTAVS